MPAAFKAAGIIYRHVENFSVLGSIFIATDRYLPSAIRYISHKYLSGFLFYFFILIEPERAA